MEEIGKVIELSSDNAKIEITPSEGCSHCQQANVCNPFGPNKKVIELRNAVNAQVGDSVRIEIPEKNRVLSILIVLGIPIFLFMIGIIIGQIISGDQLSAILGGVGLVLAFVIVKLINNYLAKKEKVLVVIKEKIKATD